MALGEKFVQGITMPNSRVHYQPATFDCDSYFGSRPQTDDIE